MKRTVTKTMKVESEMVGCDKCGADLFEWLSDYEAYTANAQRELVAEHWHFRPKREIGENDDGLSWARKGPEFPTICLCDSCFHNFLT